MISLFRGLTKLAAVVHAQGSKIAMQLHHTGRENYLLQSKRKLSVLQHT